MIMKSSVMTPRERILATFRGLPTDALPYQEIFFGNRAVSEHFGGPQKTIADAAGWISNSGQCSLLVAGFWWCPGDVYKDTAGGEHRYAGGKQWTMDDVAAMKEPDIEQQFLQLGETVDAAKARNLACHIFIMNGFHSASTVMGLENLCYTIFDNPEVVHSYIKRVEIFNRKVLERLAAFDIDFVFIDGDCAYKNGLMISPELFKEFWYEQTSLTIETCKNIGWPCCYHTDGKVDDVLPLLIELGICATHGIESAANDLAEIKQRYGDKITLIGNFDITELAWRNVDEIVSMTNKMLSIGAKDGRYIAACNTKVTDDIPLENYLAFRDCIVNWIA